MSPRCSSPYHDLRVLIPIVFLLALAITPTTGGYAQGASATNEYRLSAAFALAHYGYDPALGFEITFRPIIRNQFAFRLRGNIQMMEAYKAADDQWVAYQSFGIGMVYRVDVSETARFYAELGGFALLPDRRFTSKKFLQGIYQLNGLEIYFSKKQTRNLAFFIALGPSLINARAEKVEGQPRYGNGLIYMNGVRLYF
ncbi:MAG TPA: hypothetical protein VF490_15425 [Chryseosolibacter sp.]